MPNSFTQAYPFDSHNVRDLDTVDQGVYKYFDKEMNNDWDLIIGHMLGVDHVGHRYYPNHPEMKRKLKEVNQFISEIVKRLNNETLLLVFGDHGMTEEGNHGGDTVNERNSIIFAYSKTPFISEKQLVFNKRRNKIPQIDIVPTLSVLLNIGIPFNNLGAVIPEFFQNYSVVNDSIYINAKQVNRYLNTYDKNVKKLPDFVYESLQNKFLDLEKSFFDLNFSETKGLEYIYDAGNMCRDIWTTFDYELMLKGTICVLSAAIGAVFMIIFQLNLKTEIKPMLMTGALSLFYPLLSSILWLVFIIKKILA